MIPDEWHRYGKNILAKLHVQPTSYFFLFRHHVGTILFKIYKTLSQARRYTTAMAYTSNVRRCPFQTTKRAIVVNWLCYCRDTVIWCQCNTPCRHGVSTHRQFEYLWYILYRITAKKTTMLRNTGPFWGKYNGDRWIPLIQGHWFGKRFHNTASSLWMHAATSTWWHQICHLHCECFVYCFILTRGQRVDWSLDNNVRGSMFVPYCFYVSLVNHANKVIWNHANFALLICPIEATLPEHIFQK